MVFNGEKEKMVINYTVAERRCGEAAVVVVVDVGPTEIDLEPVFR